MRHRGRRAMVERLGDSFVISARAGEYRLMETEYVRAYEARKRAAEVLAVQGSDSTARSAFVEADAAVRSVRAKAVALVKDVTGESSWTDVNYVFPTFITTRMPIGLVGLMIAAIFAAAMSSIAAELNSLATSSVIDVYQRILRPAESDAHYLRISKLATGFWGLFGAPRLADFWQGMLGLLIVVIVLAFPQGIAGFLRDHVGTALRLVRREELVGAKA